MISEGSSVPIPKGLLRVKGFSEPVTPEFLEEAIRKSAEGGQTILLPGQAETVPGNKEASVARINLSRTLYASGRKAGMFGEEDKALSLKEDREKEEAALVHSFKEAFHQKTDGFSKSSKFKRSDIQSFMKSVYTTDNALNPSKMSDKEAALFAKSYLKFKDSLKKDKPDSLDGWECVYKYGVDLTGLKKPAHIHKDTGEKHVMLLHSVSDSVSVAYCHHLKIVYYLAPGESESEEG